MRVGINHLPSSFRDPSGFLFVDNGTLFRSISNLYQQNYDHLMQSGLYNKLVAEDLLIPHEEIQSFTDESDSTYKIIQPEVVPFISYPYEWCFSQLRDAAVTSLKIQKIALEYGMALKDASAYNMQFHKGKPILIDTLSFEIYKENQPWVAYRQFCQHFLAPLSLMAFRDVRLGQLMRIYIDGLSLDLASKLLPVSSWFKFALVSHIHLHAKAQKRYEKVGTAPFSQSFVIPANAGIQNKPDSDRSENSKRKVSKQSLIALIHHLESAITDMKWQPKGTEWAEYYEDTNYSQEAMNHKKELVEAYLSESKPRIVWDLGANTGVFSRISTDKGIETIAFDVDPAAVEKNYRQMRGTNESKMLPLCLDLTNPSPAIGWAHEERDSLVERGQADAVLALALIHHLAISNNLPFGNIAAFLSRICRFLIIEFVPKNDSQVQRLLRTREDIFTHYNQEHFETSFGDYFSILRSETIVDTQRTLYLLSAL
ncbi:MAG: SAM-dependent methyltransferase [Syntrophus sp. (in: bacteria)]|nr:SAM-dependent methyltransferase [Syntrophus sp. (in: bacteria)]